MKKKNDQMEKKDGKEWRWSRSSWKKITIRWTERMEKSGDGETSHFYAD
jgi:hypothetical protein